MSVELDTVLLEEQVQNALHEDIGSGDVTSGLVSEDVVFKVAVIGRERAVVCGKAWFNSVFACLDDAIEIDWQCDDGTAHVCIHRDIVVMRDAHTC